MASITVSVGTAPTAAELKTIDMSKVAEGHPVPDPKLMRDVQGQQGWPVIQSQPSCPRSYRPGCCPHCGAVNYDWESPYGYEWFRCWNCRGLYRA